MRKSSASGDGAQADRGATVLDEFGARGGEQSPRRSHHRANGDPCVRVGDREREKVVTRLGQAFTQGYLSVPEYDTRLSQAVQAETAETLNRLLGDLPVRRIAQSDPSRRAARVAAARLGVRIHLAAYAAASLLMIGIWLTVAVTADTEYFWPVWPIVGRGSASSPMLFPCSQGTPPTRLASWRYHLMTHWWRNNGTSYSGSRSRSTDFRFERRAHRSGCRQVATA